MLAENGSPKIFDLHPENPSDHRQTFKGVEFFSKARPQRVEVSVNFPGIFLLAQH
ncbi:MAG TPA: hypothetical protein VK206_10920 [Anaerolineales bacterium]|nr:hypothetical protein [Anaerolineales bacterium]